MPTKAIEGFVVDPLRFWGKANAVCYLFSSGNNPSQDWAWIDRPGCGTV